MFLYMLGTFDGATTPIVTPNPACKWHSREEARFVSSCCGGAVCLRCAGFQRVEMFISARGTHGSGGVTMPSGRGEWSMSADSHSRFQAALDGRASCPTVGEVDKLPPSPASAPLAVSLAVSLYTVLVWLFTTAVRSLVESELYRRGVDLDGVPRLVVSMMHWTPPMPVGLAAGALIAIAAILALADYSAFHASKSTPCCTSMSSSNAFAKTATMTTLLAASIALWVTVPTLAVLIVGLVILTAYAIPVVLMFFAGCIFAYFVFRMCSV